MESTILLPYSSILVGVGMFRVATLNDVDEGTVGGSVDAGLCETSFAPTYSHVRVMTD